MEGLWFKKVSRFWFLVWIHLFFYLCCRLLNNYEAFVSKFTPDLALFNGLFKIEQIPCKARNEKRETRNEKRETNLKESESKNFYGSYKL